MLWDKTASAPLTLQWNSFIHRNYKKKLQPSTSYTHAWSLFIVLVYEKQLQQNTQLHSCNNCMQPLRPKLTALGRELITKLSLKCINIIIYNRGAQHVIRPAEAVSVARVTCHSIFKKICPFDVSGAHFFVNLWQLLMVLFRFISKSGIFNG